MSNLRVVDFNALPKATRERFVATAKGEGEPAPVFEDTSSPTAGAIGSLVVLAMGVGLMFWVASGSFGEGVDEPSYLALYGLAGFLAMGGLFAMIRAIIVGKNMPYKLGTYLLPVDLVKAEDKTLTIQPLAEISHVNGVHQHENGTYQHTDIRLVFSNGQSEELQVFGQAEAESVMGQLQRFRAIAAAAAENQQYEVFQTLDPFFEARSDGEWDVICGTKDAAPKGGPVARETPAFIRKAWLLGLVFGVAAGGGVWHQRNVMSDEAMFESVKDSTDRYALDDYLFSGCTRHADEVNDVLIPRAEFETAKAAGSVTALRGFLDVYPDSVHEADARAAIHALFESALADFEREAEGANPNIVPIMKAMLSWLEAADSPPVAVRFREPDPSILKDVDEVVLALTKEETGGLPIAAISPSFDEGRSLARENYIVNELEAGFLRVIPADILDLELGERISPTQDLAAERPNEPTISVSYSVDASGSIYANEANTQGYVGIEIYFIVSMLIPGTDGATPPEPLTFVLDVEPPSEFSVSTDGIAIEPSDFLVYDVMAKKAFENLSTSLRGAFFATGEAGSMQVVSGAIPELPALDLNAEEGEGE